LTAVLFTGCAVPGAGTTDASRNPLRVGVTPTYPPMIFKAGGRMTGAEADMARRLAGALGRPVQFVELRWEEQIPALLAGKTDIIMSGMSITRARSVRIAFADPYVETGQLAMMRAGDATRYRSPDDIRTSLPVIGVIEGTTGDVIVQQLFPNARRVAFSRASDGAMRLRQRSIDLFVHDAPSVMWLVSENEAELTGLWKPLNEESLAWGLRRSDQELLARVNATLETWKRDGTLKQVLTQWLPRVVTIPR
jgi:polar amino acid transport system substrate-binding protein